ncbi:SOS response-associated peptidase [Chryseomicrobium palamuruense]|uniref:Abasic site processing protein n=1 Tax=Chryseomicrobium palamuruense TaxID=682973 RepID=A0ABV8UXW0_9BACL
MCGRFTLFATYADLLDYLEAEQAIPENEYAPHYNIAPTQSILAVINDGSKNRLGYLKWGLIPEWARDDQMAAKLMNARAETIHEKPSFKDSFRTKRCLIPMNGYYEWTQAYGEKAPVYVLSEQHQILLAAGIWASWTSPEGKKVFTCSILTQQASAEVSSIHHRMPVFVSKQHMQDWLNPTVTSVSHLREILNQSLTSGLHFHRVGTDVNSPKHDHPHLIKQIEAS